MQGKRGGGYEGFRRAWSAKISSKQKFFRKFNVEIKSNGETGRGGREENDFTESKRSGQY